MSDAFRSSSFTKSEDVETIKLSVGHCFGRCVWNVLSSVPAGWFPSSLKILHQHFCFQLKRQPMLIKGLCGLSQQRKPLLVACLIESCAVVDVTCSLSLVYGLKDELTSRLVKIDEVEHYCLLYILHE